MLPGCSFQAAMWTHGAAYYKHAECHCMKPGWPFYVSVAASLSVTLIHILHFNQGELFLTFPRLSKTTHKGKSLSSTTTGKQLTFPLHALQGLKELQCTSKSLK